MTGSTESAARHGSIRVINFNSRIDDIIFVFPNLDMPTDTTSNLLKVEHVHSRSFAVYSDVLMVRWEI